MMLKIKQYLGYIALGGVIVLLSFIIYLLWGDNGEKDGKIDELNVKIAIAQEGLENCSKISDIKSSICMKTAEDIIKVEDHFNNIINEYKNTAKGKSYEKVDVTINQRDNARRLLCKAGAAENHLCDNK